jgi:CHAD domain-containing protein
MGRAGRVGKETMGYQIERAEQPGAALRRVAAEEVAGALSSLIDPEDPGEGIHDARKRCKKVRAVLRLVRPHVGEEIFQRENAAYRDAGGLLAPARQADVAVETLERLIDGPRGEASVEPLLRPARRRITERRDAIVAAAFEAGGPAERARARIEEAGGRLETWPLDGLGPEAMRGGLRRVYARGAHEMGDAWVAGTGDAFHEWRKRVKYLWYHLRLLGHAWPGLLDPGGEVQHELEDLLGKANDLTDLLRLLDREPDLVEDAEAREALEALATRHRRRLWEEARPHGVRVYAAPPDAFVARLGIAGEGGRETG